MSDVPITLKGGATRSHEAPPFHLVPAEGLIRVAERFALGAVQHGPSQWKQSTILEHEAAAFCREAYNHMIEHALRLSDPDQTDDHLGAVGWAVFAIAYVEALHGMKWTELSTVDPALVEDIPF
jgi:hypothetical protein